MLVRAVNKDDNGYTEWLFCHSLADYKGGQSQVMQDIYTALYEWKYDCFFALDSGIDWYARLGTKGQKELLDKDIIALIQSRAGVLSVYNFESSVTGRNYSCSCSVFTEFSENEFNINFRI